MIVKICFAFLGAIICGKLFEIQGAFFGAIIGFLSGYLIDLNSRLSEIEKKLSELQRDVFRKQLTHPLENPAAKPKNTTPDDEETDSKDEAPKTTHDVYYQDDQDGTEEPTPSTDHPVASDETDQPQFYESKPDYRTRLFESIKTFFTTGNVVVRIGIIVLFFGVAFLFKYVADRDLLPIGVRLIAVEFGAIAMLIFGWRLRYKRFAYAVLIQGGAVGIMYLVIFAAAKLYAVMAMDLAFLMMVAVVALTGILSLAQDAKSLAVFGVCGGFLAPILMLTGRGSHVTVFSYYALLNICILGISRFKVWRVLNLLGFAFTFIIGLLWGSKYYQPSYFSTTEPFLILFFLFYVAISVLFAHRQPLKLRGYIDGTLVFGLPLIAFGLQCALVKEFEYGSAISALVLSIFYICLGISLWKRKIEGMYMLAETFLALGVVFFSLSIPLAFDSNWTTGLWSIEGLGLIWIGFRQNRVLARSFGIILQLGAGVAFVFTASSHTNDIFILNSIYMSCLVISIAGILSHFCYEFYRDRLKSWEMDFHFFTLGWSLLWWFGGGINEINSHCDSIDKAHLILLFTTVSCWFMAWLNRRFKWSDMPFPPIGLLPVSIFITLISFLSNSWNHPIYRWGFAALPLFMWVNYQQLRWFEEKWNHKLVRIYHQTTLCFIIFILAWEASWGIDQIIEGAETWRFVVWGAVPSFIVLFLFLFGRWVSWPIKRFESDYFGTGLLPVIGYIFLWLFGACFKNGDPKPLHYLPLLNPIDVVQIFALLVVIKWRKETKQQTIYPIYKWPPQTTSFLIAIASFFWINAFIARTVHFWCSVPFDISNLYGSPQFQMAISIVWTLISLGAMVFSSIKTIREVWFAGAVLLGIVVIKLFLVDLDDIGTVARIITFLVVGILMLVIGYFSPLPPKKADTD